MALNINSKNTAYKGKVNQGLDKLEELIEKLKACIDKLSRIRR